MGKRIILWLLPALLVSLIAQSAGYDYRYWFDQDEDNAVYGTMPGRRLHVEADAGALSPSLHTFNIQVKDSEGSWSAPRTNWFARMTGDLERAFYWFDNDTLMRHESPALQGRVEIDVTSLPEGVHTLHYAAMTTDGTLTAVVTRWFVRGPLVEEATSLRCLWSIDGGETHVGSCSIADDSHIHLDLDVKGLSLGRHYITLTVLDDNDCGSSVSTYFLVVEPEPGDVNGDGFINGADVTALYGVLLDGDTVEGDPDVNGDGVVSGADVTALYGILLSQ